MGNFSSLREQASAGKSGSIFFYSSCGNFLLKTIDHSEFYFLRDILADYFNHLKENKDTFIARFYGMHKIKYGSNKRLYFIIMANVFNTTREIHKRYDLKGSTHGRFSKSDDSTVAGKDLNFLEQEEKIKFPKSIRSKIIDQLKLDVEFFQRNNINDYSVLLGRHDLTYPKSDAKDICSKSVNIFELIKEEKRTGEDKGIPFFEVHDGGILN